MRVGTCFVKLVGDSAKCGEVGVIVPTIHIEEGIAARVKTRHITADFEALREALSLAEWCPRDVAKFRGE